MDQKNNETLMGKHIHILLESLSDGVFTVNRQGRIMSWNRAMETITGHKKEDVINSPCSVLELNSCLGGFCPEDPEECEIFSKEKVVSKECLLRHRDGHDVPILKNASVMKDDEGEVIGVVETVTDLSEMIKARKRADEAMLKLAEIHRFSNIIGKSKQMREVFTAIKRAAASDATILVQGDSGTGKELVAGAIHYNSVRVDNLLVTVNCSALSESLLESELFGHVKGAFTGAVRDRIGRFEEAHGGTIFLDEIGEISPLIQVKLLRVLQEREIERVGDSKKRKIDIRIIAATHRNLMELVREGRFREDLYYRLKVFPISMPPLRTHRDDIPLLVSHFIQRQNKKTGKKIKGATSAAMRIFMDYNWPGNVRELENAVEHAFVLCTGELIDVQDLPVEIRHTEYQPVERAPDAPRRPPAPRGAGISREALVELLEECGWNKAEAGRRLNLSRTAIWKYMKKWDIPLQKQDGE